MSASCCRLSTIVPKTLTTADKWQRYKRGRLIIKHAKRRCELIFAFVFFTPSVLLLWLSCVASSHFHFWSASLDSCYCERHPRSTSENLSRCMQPQTSSPLDPFLHVHGSKAWFMEAIRSIGCKNPLTSTQLILFVVRMWLKHHLPGLKIRYRGRLGWGPVFSERFCPRKKKRAKKSSKIQTLKRLIRNRVKMS